MLTMPMIHAIDPNLSELTNRIINAIDRPMTTLEVATATNIAPATARKHLYRLASRGYLTRPYRGVYAPAKDTHHDR